MELGQSTSIEDRVAGLFATEPLNLTPQSQILSDAKKGFDDVTAFRRKFHMSDRGQGADPNAKSKSDGAALMPAIGQANICGESRFPRKDHPMPEISVTLVDRTGVASPSHENFKAGIMRELENILMDLISSTSDITVVNARWVSQSPADGDQDLVIHWVPDRDHSYLRSIWPSTVIDINASGHTNRVGGIAGSEFYRKPRLNSPSAYAKIAAHEVMHNITGLNNRQLHGQMGLAGDSKGTPQLPPIANDKTLAQAAMQRGLPKQLL